MKVPGLMAGVAMAATVAVITGCGSSDSSSKSSSSGTQTAASSGGGSSSKICAPKKTIALIDIYGSSPIDAKVDDMAKLAAKELGWNVQFTDAGADVSKAQTAVNNAVQSKADLILLTSFDQAPVRQALEAAKQANIPTVELAAGTQPTNLFTAAYNEDEAHLAQIMGEYIAKTQPNAKVGDLSTSFNYSGVQREQGFKAGLAGKSAKIVADQQIDAANIVPSTTKVLTDMLTGHPDIDAVWAVFDPSAVPAASVIRTQRSKAKLYTNFATPSNLSLIKRGDLTAVTDDNLALTAAVAIDQYLNHAKTGAAFDPNAVEKAGGLGYRIVTDPNQTYDNAKTLAPFLKKWAATYKC